MLKKKPKWSVPGPEIEKISQRLIMERPMPMHFARMLALRDITSVEEADAFVDPSLDNLRDPF